MSTLCKVLQHLVVMVQACRIKCYNSALTLNFTIYADPEPRQPSIAGSSAAPGFYAFAKSASRR
jgi:hypothetical protein